MSKSGSQPPPSRRRSSTEPASARRSHRRSAGPRPPRGKATAHASQTREDDQDDQNAERLSRRDAERSAKEAGMLNYLRTRNRRVFGAVTNIISESRRAPGILPALAELVDYLKIEARREALIQVRRELRYGITAEQ